MLTPFTEYPVRPRMEKGESLAGYIRRFQAANGHKMPRALCDALRTLYRGTEGGATVAFDLVQATFADVARLDRRWWLGRKLDDRSRGSGGHPRAWVNMNFDVLHLCPACVRDSGIYFALCELPLMEACPLHHCALLTACPACTVAFHWQGWLPDWHCQCGLPLTTLPLVPPAPGALAVACMLLGSNDLVLPELYPSPSIAPRRDQYRLEEVYMGLEWGTALRNLFLKRLRKGERRAERRLFRERWGFWERRLIDDSPEKLMSRLLRVQSKYFKSPQCLSRLAPDTVLAKAMAFVQASPSGVVQTKIRKTLARYFEEYALALPVSCSVWFSEARHSAQRKAYMRQFAVWWAALAARIDDLDPAIQQADSAWSYQGEKQGDALIEKTVIDLLNLFFDAASQRLDVENFRELAYWWRIPPALRDVSDPEALFRRIGLHLASIPSGEVLFVLDLVQRARKGK